MRILNKMQAQILDFFKIGFANQIELG